MNSAGNTTEKLYVGIKQATKAVMNGYAKKAYVANCVEPHMRNEFVKLCKKNSVPIEVVKNPSQLGVMCGIEVGASVAVIAELH